MNTVWSEHVQGTLTLYLSRKLRFDDLFFPQYEKLFDLSRDRALKILEVGCGPGALAGALRRWYPMSRITAVDRDSSFIRFAKAHEPGIEFLEGDAAALPFPDGTFDVTISNTVQEHVEHGAFWGEQRRVLKPGGICLCLSARKGINCKAACLEPSEEERRFWDAMPSPAEEMEKYQVCRYPMSEAELPAAMEANGFTGITTGYAVIDLTPDHPKYSAAQAEMMIEAMRQNNLEALRSTGADGTEPILQAANSRFDERLRLYRTGNRQWDTSVSVTMVLRGVK